MELKRYGDVVIRNIRVTRTVFRWWWCWGEWSVGRFLLFLDWTQSSLFVLFLWQYSADCWAEMSYLINGRILRMTPEWCRTMIKRLPSPLSSSSITSSPFTNNCSVTPVRLNCHRASITRIHRAIYTKPYKSLLCLQDGSTVTVRTKWEIKPPVNCSVIPRTGG